MERVWVEMIKGTRDRARDNERVWVEMIKGTRDRARENGKSMGGDDKRDKRKGEREWKEYRWR